MAALPVEVVEAGALAQAAKTIAATIRTVKTPNRVFVRILFSLFKIKNQLSACLTEIPKIIPSLLFLSSLQNETVLHGCISYNKVFG
jgi:hypothetical protein